VARFELDPLDTTVSGGREVFVGWDDGLQTFFAQVIDGAANGEEILTLDLGNDIEEFVDVEVVLDAVRPFAEVPDLVEILLANMATPAIGDLGSGELLIIESQDAILDSAYDTGYPAPGFGDVDDAWRREDDPPIDEVEHDAHSGLGY